MKPKKLASRLKIYMALQKLHRVNILTDDEIAGHTTILYNNKVEDFYKINETLIKRNPTYFYV